MRSTSSTCIGIRCGAALPPRDVGVTTDEVRRRYRQHLALVVKHPRATGAHYATRERTSRSPMTPGRFRDPCGAFVDEECTDICSVICSLWNPSSPPLRHVEPELGPFATRDVDAVLRVPPSLERAGLPGESRPPTLRA
jgi:hypothetical protein